MNPPNPVSTAVPSQRDDIEVFQMKAHNVHNPTAVGGGASHVSVGLQQQMSPREYTEKKMKELEHRVSVKKAYIKATVQCTSITMTPFSVHM